MHAYFMSMMFKFVINVLTQRKTAEKSAYIFQKFISRRNQMSRVMRKPTFWFPTWSDTNQTVQLQQMARDLKFRIYEVEGFYYPCSESENKGADQLRSYREADLRLCFRICKVLVFAFAKCWFSHDAAHIILNKKTCVLIFSKLIVAAVSQ